MKGLVGALLMVGLVMVYLHWVLGVLVLVAAAWWVPIVIHQIHEERDVARRRAEVAGRSV